MNLRKHAKGKPCMVRLPGCDGGGEIKDWIKSEYGPSKVITIGDQQKTVAMGSSEWNVETCSMVIEHLYRIGADVGLVFQEDE